MVVSPGAIDRYLNVTMPLLPQFKELDYDACARIIQNCTGVYPQFTTPPRYWQMQGLAFALYLRNALLYFDPRLGKSKLSLDWADTLLRAGLWSKGKGLVIAHAPIAIDVWETEFAKHSQFTWRVAGTKFNDWADAIESDCHFVLTTRYSLQEMCGFNATNRKGVNKIYPYQTMLADLAPYFGVAIIDEIHSYKSHRSLSFQIIAQLTAQCQWRLGLTGTPYSRDMYAVWAEAFLVDRGGVFGYNYYFFEQAFGKQQKNFATGLNEYKFDAEKTNALMYKLGALAMTYKMREVRTVSVERNTIRTHMYGKQLEAYGQVIEKLVQINQTDQAEILNTFVRLRQVSSGFLPFTDSAGVQRVLRFDENPKLEWIAEFFEHAPNDVQIMLVHEFIESGSMIDHALTKAKVSHSWLYGGTKNTRDVLEQFKSGQSQVLLVNHTKGGLSIDLPMADCIIFYESPTSSIIRQQVEMRPMSRDEGRMLSIEDMVTSGTEQRILDLIGEGRDLADELTRNRQWLLEQFRIDAKSRRTAPITPKMAASGRKRRAISTT